MARKKRRMFAILTLLVLFIISCNFVAATATPDVPVTVMVEPTSISQNVLQSEADVPRIPVEEALAAVQSGAAVVVDVRSTQAYDISHVPGALSIPLAEIETNLSGLPLEKDQWIITYCT